MAFFPCCYLTETEKPEASPYRRFDPPDKSSLAELGFRSAMEGLCSKKTILGLCPFLLLLLCFFPFTNAELERFEQPVKADGSTSFL
ncbi:hypothetical protein CRG98_026156, partial [Punica granatum]